MGPPQGLGAVLVQYGRLLDHEQWLATECLAGLARVVRRHQVGMGASRPVAGQAQHLGAEGRQHHRRPLAVSPEVGRSVQGIEVVGHGLDRRKVGGTAVPLDQREVADPQSEDEATRRQRLDEPRARRGRHRAPGIDIGDASAHDQPSRGARESESSRQALPPVGLAEPEGPEAEGLDLSHRFEELRGRKGLEGAGPESDPVLAKGGDGGHGVTLRRAAVRRSGQGLADSPATPIRTRSRRLRPGRRWSGRSPCPTGQWPPQPV